MVLVKDGAVAEDEWVAVGDGDALPSDSPAIVSADRWTAERDALAQRNAPLGIRLSSDTALEDVADAIGRVALIALEFPAFTDGRPYSTARLLRERHGFTGELRAVGQVLRDQAQFMQRCGFDSFELPEQADAGNWIEGLSDIAVHYQPTADVRSSVATLRQR